MYRTKTCGELNIKNVKEHVELAGWIQKIRDLGGMTFIDLRDEFGITQIVVNSEELKKFCKRITYRKLYPHRGRSCGKSKQKFAYENRRY